jgi:hypothetical protein
MKRQQELAPLAGGEITHEIALNRADFESLLLALGVAAGASFRDGQKTLAERFIRLANTVNKDNPAWTPYQTGAEAEAAGRAAYEADATGNRPCRGCGVVNGPHDTNCRVAYSLAARYEAEHRRVHGHTSWCDAFNDGQRECNCSTGPQAAQGVTEPKEGKS